MQCDQRSKPPSGVVCNGKLTLYNFLQGCAYGAASGSLSECNALDAVYLASGRVEEPLTPSGGSCAISAPSTPQGGVQGAEPVTVCCLP